MHNLGPYITQIEQKKIRKKYLMEFLDFHGVNPKLIGFDWLCNTDFFEAPASKRYHGSYIGGLFDHSMNVAKELVKLTKANRLVWQRPESPTIIGILHDVTKIGLYTWDTNGTVFNTNPEYLSLTGGHGSDSVEKILSHGLELTPEEQKCIRFHMGAYETDAWTEFDLAIKEYSNVLWTHMADMIASKLVEDNNGE